MSKPTIHDALGYSRNFAEASPYLTKTAKEHITGLCNLLEITAAQRDELLTALRDVLPYAEACIGATHRANPPSDSVITAAKAAIAKAGGA